MSRTSSRTAGGILAVALLMMLVFTLSPLQTTLAAMNVGFDNIPDNISVDAVASGTIPDIVSMVSSDPNNTVKFEAIADLLGGAPFAGEVPVSLTAGVTMTITFSLPQTSYQFDFATRVGDGADTFTVEGLLGASSVFTDNYPVTALLTPEVDLASGNSATFDHLVISSTTTEWAIDNLVTAGPGIDLIESGGSTNVTEGNVTTDSYTIALDIPVATGQVKIDIATNGQCTATPNQVTYTTGQSGPSTITVASVDDPDVEASPHDCVITHSRNATTSDPAYSGITGRIVAHVTDNDVPPGSPDITLVQSGGTTNITEGSTTDSYTLVLETQPTDDVVITATPGVQCTVDTDPGVGTSNVATFTTANWNVAQTITVTAVDDDIAEDATTCSISHAVVSTDIAYNGFVISGSPVVANVTDDDTAGVSVSAASGGIAESGTTATYTVVLTSQPTASVTVTASPNPGTPNNQCTVDSPTDSNPGTGVNSVLTFTTANWNTAQTITVAAVNDDIDEGAHNCVINHAATSGDAKYNGITVTGSPVTAAITDNDTAGVTISAASGGIVENGATATYTVVLTSQPTANVTVTGSPDAQCTVDTNAPGTSNVATFTSANWNVAQIFTATAVNDDIVEGAHNCVISHAVASSDTKYNGITATGTPVTVAVTDNDTAGVTITETAGTNISEAGTTDTYTIKLTSQPTATVTVTITPDAQCTVDTDPGVGTSNLVTFTTGTTSWHTAQTVTVTAVNDVVPESNHDCVISHTVASGDTHYNPAPFTGNPVTAHITDNDISPVNAAPTRNFYTTGTPTLTWTGTNNAIRYELQVSNNMTFTGVGVRNYAPGTALFFTIPGGTPLTNGVYYWRVRACSTATVCAAYSPVQSFTIAS